MSQSPEELEKPQISHYIDFSTPNPNFFDGVIIAEEQKFYINKMTLARNCKFFSQLFYGDPQIEECHLQDVEKEHLQVFLEAVHGAVFLDADRVTGVALLSKKWECLYLVEECIEFLLQNSEDVTILAMLELGVALDSEEVKTKALSRIKTVYDLSGTVPQDVSVLNPSLQLILFQKSMDFHRPPLPPKPIKLTDEERVHAVMEFIMYPDEENRLLTDQRRPIPNPEYESEKELSSEQRDDVQRLLENMDAVSRRPFEINDRLEMERLAREHPEAFPPF